MESKITDLSREINHLVMAVARTGSTALLAGPDNLEREKAEMEEKLLAEQESVATTGITEDQIRAAYRTARELFASGDFHEYRQLINPYVERVCVFNERIVTVK